MKNQKGISTPFAILIVGVVAIIGFTIVFSYQYIWTPEEGVTLPLRIEKPKDETADWKTYRNEEYDFLISGFEIRHPENWHPSEISFLEIWFARSFPENSKEYVVIKISIVKDKYGKLVDPQSITNIESFKEKVGQIYMMGKIIEEGRKVNIEDIRGYKIIAELCVRGCRGYSDDQFAPFSIVYLMDDKNKKVYGVSYFEGISGVGSKKTIEEWRYYSEFKQILSTFKFIKIEKTVAQELTIEKIKNAKLLYFVGASEITEPVQYINGVYYRYKEGEEVRMGKGEGIPLTEAQKRGYNSKIQENNIAFGDLNNDGKKDAAVITGARTGGTGYDVDLQILINQQGNPQYITSKSLGDRVKINSISIQLGQIIIDMVTHGPNDAACCPTVEKIVKYELSKDELVEVE